jgi:hypothetical protein
MQRRNLIIIDDPIEPDDAMFDAGSGDRVVLLTGANIMLRHPFLEFGDRGVRARMSLQVRMIPKFRLAAPARSTNRAASGRAL